MPLEEALSLVSTNVVSVWPTLHAAQYIAPYAGFDRADDESLRGFALGC